MATATILVVSLLEVMARPTSALAAGCGVVGYSYDTAGRVAGAIDQAGQTMRYQYDQSGNVLVAQNLGTQQLSVLAMTPPSGPRGTQVTLSGGCFAMPPTPNEVRFNGVAAAIVSVSPTRLTAVVPQGVPTGPVGVSVTAGGVTAFSPMSFTVNNLPTTLSVTGVGPPSAGPGGTVTVTGTGFDAGGWEVDPSANVAAVNAMRARVLSATATQLTVEVPATVSGRLAVRTSRGLVNGPDLWIPPAPFTVNDIAWGSRTSPGVAQTMQIPTAGRRVALLVADLAQGARASVTLSSNTFTACGSVQVLDPHGTVIASAPCVGATTIGPFTARVPGTYELVYVTPVGTTGSVAGRFDSPPAGALAVASPSSFDPLSRGGLTGQVLRAGDGQPLRAATARLGQRISRTDHHGWFRFAGVAEGHHELIVDGGADYGIYEIGVDVSADETLTLRTRSGFRGSTPGTRSASRRRPRWTPC